MLTDTEELAVTDEGSHNVLEDEVEWEVFPGNPKPTAVTDSLAEMLCVRKSLDSYGRKQIRKPKNCFGILRRRNCGLALRKECCWRRSLEVLCCEGISGSGESPTSVLKLVDL
jgi:hypothetical protein